MSDVEPISKTRFQELVNPIKPLGDESPDERPGHDSEYMWYGQRYRVVPLRQAPLLQFRILLSPQESLQIKYAFVTYQNLLQQNAEHKNELTMIIRDSMRITLVGFNLWPLDDALLVQKVAEIQFVSKFQATAALKRGEDGSIVQDIRVEYGRFDIENRLWLPGNGFWCEQERRWMSQSPVG